MFCDIIRYVDYYSITLINRQHGGSLVPKLALTLSMSCLKVRQRRNVSFKPTILPENERTNSVFLPNSIKNEFFRKSGIPKSSFEIN